MKSGVASLCREFKLKFLGADIDSFNFLPLLEAHGITPLSTTGFDASKWAWYNNCMDIQLAATLLYVAGVLLFEASLMAPAF
ncbi:MAG: hypothetical protein WAP51_04645 [Candidatus Sungiibacteriota bacterium]